MSETEHPTHPSSDAGLSRRAFMRNGTLGATAALAATTALARGVESAEFHSAPESFERMIEIARRAGPEFGPAEKPSA